MDIAFRESLAADQLKENDALTAAIAESECLSLQLQRAGRVLPESLETDVHIVISIRHPLLGTLRRRFNSDSLFFGVYDWAGSLSQTPKYFGLFHPSREMMLPSTPIKHSGQVVFSMEDRDTPVIFEDDGENNFLRVCSFCRFKHNRSKPRVICWQTFLPTFKILKE